MNVLKKIGALASASALTGVVVFAGAVAVASAAPVTLVIDKEVLLPGESVNVTIDGCSVGSTLTISLNGEVLEDEVVAEGDLPIANALAWEDLDGGLAEFSITCTPAAESEEVVSSADASFYVFGDSYVEAMPETFFTGDTVSITAGDFVAGSTVILKVIPQGSTEAVYSVELGTAEDDFSVTGDVVFPKTLENGQYVLEFSDGVSDIVKAELFIGARPTTEPTPSATPSATASPSASASATPTMKPTTVRPGLPSTGN